jgi:hypothetical protein
MAYKRYHSPRGEELRRARHNKRLADLWEYIRSPMGRINMVAAEQYRRLDNFMDAKRFNWPPSEKILKARARRERKRQQAVEWGKRQIELAQKSMGRHAMRRVGRFGSNSSTQSRDAGRRTGPVGLATSFLARSSCQRMLTRW